MTQRGTVVLALVVALAGGCSVGRGPAHPGDGPHVEQDRVVEEFSSIELSGAFIADVKVGKKHSVTLEGELDQVEDIETSVDHGQLRVAFRRGTRGHDAVIVHIVAPNIEAIETSGATELDVAGLRGQSFALEVNGSTRASLDGEITALHAEINGTGELDSTDLLAQSVAVEVNGTGQADVTALEQLDAEVNGAGRIRYRGTPKVAKEVHGVGRIRPF